MNEMMYASALHILKHSIALTVLLLLIAVGAKYRVIQQEVLQVLREGSCGARWLVKEGFLEEGRVVLNWPCEPLLPS